MIQSRKEACRILGVPLMASLEIVRKEYRNLIKVYHPDVYLTGNETIYRRATEAYEYLCAHPVPEPVVTPTPGSYTDEWRRTSMYSQSMSGGQSMSGAPGWQAGFYQAGHATAGMATGGMAGSAAGMAGAPAGAAPGRVLGNTTNMYHRGSNYEEFERKYQKQRQEQAVAREKEREAYAKEQARREKEYQDAMEAIQSIRLAEALKAMIRQGE